MTSFISEWKTDNAGTSNDDQITLPLVSGGTYDFTVDWGDGSTPDEIDAYDDAAVTHTFTGGAGTYEVEITGTITGWRFNNGGDKLKILDISEWGPFRQASLSGAFYGCSNLDCSAADGLVTTGLTTFYQAFRDCSSLTALDVSSWDVSDVTNFAYAFYNCSSLTALDVSSWDVSDVTTTFYAAFGGCSSLTALDVSSWDVSAVTTFAYAFQNCSSLTALDVSSWDVSDVTTFASTFSGVTLDRTSYDQMLISFGGQVVTASVPFHGGSSKYTPNSAAEAARDVLTGTYSWSITDGGAAAAPTNVWTGVTDDDSSDGSNWSLEIVPTSAHNVWFDGVASDDCVLAETLACNTFNGDGSFTNYLDPNGQTINCEDDCDWAAGFAMAQDADAMNGCTWNIGGDFTADGQTLNATAVWYLYVTGTAVASGTGDVEYSDASDGAGSTEIDASDGPWTDSGNNDNWNFGAAGEYVASVAEVVPVVVVPEITASALAETTASVAEVVPAVVVNAIAAEYAGVYDASAAEVAASVVVPEITASSVAEYAATVIEVVPATVINDVTGAYESELAASVAEVVPVVAVPEITASAQGEYVASVAEVAPAVVVPEITASAIAEATASVAEVVPVVTIPEITASSATGSVASVAPVVPSVAVSEVIAGYASELSAEAAVVEPVVVVSEVSPTFTVEVTATATVTVATVVIPEITAVAAGEVAISERFAIVGTDDTRLGIVGTDSTRLTLVGAQ